MSLSDRKNQPQNNSSGAAQIAKRYFMSVPRPPAALVRPEKRDSKALWAAPAAMTRTAARRSELCGAENAAVQRSAEVAR